MEYKSLKEAREKGGLVSIHHIKKELNKSSHEIRRAIKKDKGFPVVWIGRYCMFDKDGVVEYAKENEI